MFKWGRKRVKNQFHMKLLFQIVFGSARNSFRNTPLPGTIDFQSRFPKVDFHESRLDGIKIDRIDEFNFGKMYRAEFSGRTRTWT